VVRPAHGQGPTLSGRPLVSILRLGVGGRLGSGRQWWSLISLDDQVAGIRHLISTDTLEGPVNFAAPEQVTNSDLTAALGRAVHRPTFAIVPRPVLRAVLGEFADELLIDQRMAPRCSLGLRGYPTVATSSGPACLTSGWSERGRRHLGPAAASAAPTTHRPGRDRRPPATRQVSPGRQRLGMSPVAGQRWTSPARRTAEVERPPAGRAHGRCESDCIAASPAQVAPASTPGRVLDRIRYERLGTRPALSSTATSWRRRPVT
jgi:hypothetical protein